MKPLSRSGFWLSLALLVGLLVLMLVLTFRSPGFGTSAEGTSQDDLPVQITVTCSSVLAGAHERPRGFSVSASDLYSSDDEPAWSDHCSTLRAQRTGWLALLAVPTAVLAVLCLVRRPEQLIGQPRVKPKLGPLYTPSIE